MKLKRCGITNNELQWFRSYLENRQQLVAIKNVLSDPCNIKAGVPQGSILGPILFLLFINDMPEVLSQCSIEMYADDTLLYFHGTDLNTIERVLNNDLKQFTTWLHINQMNVNVSKTKVMVLSSVARKLDVADVNICLNGQRLECVNTMKYLGVTIDNHLKWHNHLDNVCKNVGKKIAVLRRIKPFLPKDALKTIYNTTILPLFDYANIVWSSCGEKNLKRLQVLQNKAMRTILGAHYLTHSKDLLNELNFMSIRDRIIYLNGCMVYKALNDQTPEYLSSKFIPIHSKHTYRTRSSSQGNLQTKRFKTNYGKATFHYQGSLTWNVICPQVRKNPSLNAFKKHLKSELM